MPAETAVSQHIPAVALSDRSTPRCRTGRVLRVAATISLVVWAAFLSSCGYRVVGSVGKLPDGIRSVGVPTFDNRSPQFRIEQRLTSAVLRELNTRTRIPVVSSSSGVDAVLVGEIRTVNSSPVTFGGDTFGSAFLVTVQIAVKLVRVRDSAVIWQNGDFLFRERYTLNTKVQDFFEEEGPALDRLSREFAASLISTLLGIANP